MTQRAAATPAFIGELLRVVEGRYEIWRPDIRT